MIASISKVEDREMGNRSKTHESHGELLGVLSRDALERVGLDQLELEALVLGSDLDVLGTGVAGVLLSDSIHDGSVQGWEFSINLFPKSLWLDRLHSLCATIFGCMCSYRATLSAPHIGESRDWAVKRKLFEGTWRLG